MKHLTLFLLVGIAAFLAWREGIFASFGLGTKPSAAFGGGASSSNLASGAIAPTTGGLGQGSGNLGALDSRQAYSSVPLAYVPGGITPTGPLAWVPISERIARTNVQIGKMETIGFSA